MGVLEFFNNSERPPWPHKWRWGVGDGAGRFQGGGRSVVLAAQVTNWLRVSLAAWDGQMVRRNEPSCQLKQFSVFEESQRPIWRAECEWEEGTAVTAPMCPLGRLMLSQMSLGFKRLLLSNTNPSITLLQVFSRRFPNLLETSFD